MTLLALLKAIHLLSAILWVGGMFFAYVVLRPSLVVLEPPQRMLLHTQVFKRFFLIVWHAMPLLLLTGYGMIFGVLGGMAHLAPGVHAMMGLGLVMSAVFLFIFFGPYKRFCRTTDRATMAASMDSIRKLIGVNLVLGVLTVLAAALG